MSVCAACGRPVAMARAQCLYCGASLDSQAVAEAAEATERLQAAGPLGRQMAPEEPSERWLVVARLAGEDPARLQAALEISSYEAMQRSRRPGLELLFLLDPEAARERAARLEEQGLEVYRVPEVETQPAREPLPAEAGSWHEAGLELRVEGESLSLRPDQLLLAVRGPIAREYQTTPDRLKHVPTAAPSPGHRVQLHRVEDGPPVELDLDAIEISGPRRFPTSALLELSGWLGRLLEPERIDDGFKRLSPALAPATPLSTPFVPRAEFGPRQGGPPQAMAVLDNVQQFRFYSGWRGAVERRRRR